MNIFCIYTALALFCSCSPHCSTFRALDKHIQNIEAYESAFSRQADSLKAKLESEQDNGKWDICKQLFDSYMHYKLDSCCRYVDAMSKYAGNDIDKQTISASCRVRLLYRKNFLLDALELYESIDSCGISREAAFHYISTGSRIYRRIAAQSIDSTRYRQKARQCDSVLVHFDIGGSYRIIAALNLKTDKENYNIVKEHLEISTTPAEAASANYLMGKVLISMGDRESAIPYLVKSACMDIELAVKDNNALYLLAKALYEQGNIRRAARYLKQIIDDNRFCGYPALMDRNSKLDSIISSAIEEQNAIHKGLYCAIIVLVLIIILLLSYHYRRQSIYNKRLEQASKNKNVLIAKYLELAADYICEVDNIKNSLRKTARKEGKDAVIQQLMTAPYADSEFPNFKKIFDEFFTWLYPDFADDINNIILENAYPIRAKSGLNTELRILALIWLGISDRQKISKILHLSVQSVYTYHSLIQKSSCFSGDDFDKAIQTLPDRLPSIAKKA